MNICFQIEWTSPGWWSPTRAFFFNTYVARDKGFLAGGITILGVTIHVLYCR